MYTTCLAPEGSLSAEVGFHFYRMSNGNVDLVMKKIRHKDLFLINATDWMGHMTSLGRNSLLQSTILSLTFDYIGDF